MTKLEKLLKYVSEHNDFYKNRIKEYGIKDPLDITQWPVLTRKELQENRYNMFSDGYKSKYYNQRLRRQSSSGSSGMPVNVYWDYKDWYVSNLSVWRLRHKWYGISPNDKCVMFTLNVFNIQNDGDTVYYLTNPSSVLFVNVSLIYDDQGYIKLLDIINEYRPKWMYIQPFVLNKLIRAYKCSKKTPPSSLKYIESVGELLSLELKKKATDFFEVSLANMYGSEEMNSIAIESPNGKMTILDSNVFVEIKTKTEITQFGNGEAIVTNLNNLCQPLIRYNQGDSIIISNDLIDDKTRVIELIKGRTLDSFIINDDEEINSIMLLEMMAEINNYFPQVIKEYNFMFDTKKVSLKCYLTIEPSKKEWFVAVKSAIIKSFQQKIFPLNSCSIEVMSSKERACLCKKNPVLTIE
ncbi:MAG: AMP-binding protein [Clostridia bacterium]|nr:AMP-binding protein [Clostridia bacterium]